MNEIGWPLSFARQDIWPGVRSPIASLYILCICLRLERMKPTVDIELSFPVTQHCPTRAASLCEYTPPQRCRQRCPRGGQPDCRWARDCLSAELIEGANPTGIPS